MAGIAKPLVSTDRPRNLVLISKQDQNQRSDFLRISEYIEASAPDVRPIVLKDRRKALWRHKLRLMWRPTIVVSPIKLQVFQPLRGTVFQGQPLTKSEECRALDAYGIPVPRWAVLTPNRVPNLENFGPYVVVKPDSGARGAEVRIMRTGRVKWRPPEKEFRTHSGNWVVQEFIYTGPWPVSYRVVTLFGRALWSMRAEADHGSKPLPHRYAFGDGGYRGIVASGMGSSFQLNYDREIIAFAERAHMAFPTIPLLGVDILREQPSGRLYVIEVNAMGFVWHLSSPVGLSLQRSHGFDLESQFDGLREAARVLVDQTRAHAR
jgi:hypothetical protein